MSRKIYKNKWRSDKKQKIIESFGGECALCGYSKCNSSLALHHINPSEKEMGFTDKSWIKLIPELRKCCLLCHNCHAEIHAHVITLPTDVKRFDESFAVI
jgi:hypothetical protein